jgi:hypothetical protein
MEIEIKKQTLLAALYDAMRMDGVIFDYLNRPEKLGDSVLIRGQEDHLIIDHAIQLWLDDFKTKHDLKVAGTVAAVKILKHMLALGKKPKAFVAIFDRATQEGPRPMSLLVWGML